MGSVCQGHGCLGRRRGARTSRSGRTLVRGRRGAHPYADVWALVGIYICAPCTTWHRTCYFELRWPKRGASQVPAFTTENRALVKARRPGVSVRTTATGTTALRRSYDPKAVVPHVPTCVFECSIHDCVTVHSPCPCSNMLLLSVLRCGCGGLQGTPRRSRA